MRIALPCKVSKTAVNPLSSSVPGRPSEPTVLPAKVLRAPSSHSQATAKNGASRRLSPQIPKNRNCFPLLLDTNHKGELRLVQPRIVRRLTA